MNRVELRQLEMFLAVVEERHFTRAAARCNVSQSALSAAIRTLERDLDAPLFLRTTRRVELTEAGAALAVEARRTLDAAAAALAAVRAASDEVQGTLFIGGVRTQGRYDQIGVIKDFIARHPGVDVSYRSAPSSSLVEDVAAGRLHLAFVTLPQHLPPNLVARQLFDDPLGVVCPPDDPLARRRRVKLADLAERNLIGGPPGSLLQTVTERALQPPGRRVTLVVNDILALLDFVEAGLGVAIAAEVDAAERPPLHWVPIADVGVRWRFGVVTGPVALLPRAATAFLDML